MVFVVPVIAALTFSGAAAGTLWFRRWAERHQILDIPNERSSHTQPTPRGAGVVIAAVSLLGAWAVMIALQRPWLELHAFLLFSAGALLVTAVSWLDDLRSLTVPARLAVQIAAAILVISAYGYWKVIVLPGWGPVAIGSWGIPLTLLWVVGLTNAYNFMDGIDGIAGCQAVVAGLSWAWLGGATQNATPGVVGLLLAAASLGFLLHNWPPARIFMGDVGSAFLGYSFAALPLMFAFEQKPNLDSGRSALLGAAVVWPFIFDAAFTVCRRLRQRENIFEAHRTHLYQRLVITGWSHSSVALLYAGLALAGAVTAGTWLSFAPGRDSSLILFPLLALALWLTVLWLENHNK